jgi:hypothetical protein
VDYPRRGCGEVYREQEEKKMTKRELFTERLLKIQDANTAGAAWMKDVLILSENSEEWLELNFQEFLQIVADVDRPAFPTFETTAETDAAYRGAWGQLEFSRKLYAEDAIYQEDLNRRKTEGMSFSNFL